MSHLLLTSDSRDALAYFQTQQGGSMLLESALILPVFFTLLFGIFGFACACTGYCSATYATRLGARYASYRSNTSLAVTGSAGPPMPSATQTAAVVSSVQRVLFTPAATTPTISISYSNPLGASTSGNYIGNAVTVSTSWTQQFALPGYKKTLSFTVQAGRIILR